MARGRKRKQKSHVEPEIVVVTKSTIKNQGTLNEFEIKDIPEISPAYVKKIRSMGIERVADLAVANPEDLINAVSIKREDAAQLIWKAQQLLRDNNYLPQQFKPATEELKRREGLYKMRTGSSAFDALLKGGFETGATWEIYGEFGAGKSQIAHSLAVKALQPLAEGGLDSKNVIWIDTEGTFRPERIVQIATENGLDTNDVLKRIQLCRIINASNLELVVKELSTFIREMGVRFVVIDSIIAAHRVEFTGRGTLYDKQHRLNVLLKRLTDLTTIQPQLCIVFTNQVVTDPSMMFGDPVKPSGGNVIAHGSTYRIYIRKAGDNRLVKIVDSPYHPYSDVKIHIGAKGIEDIKEE